jgi:hypothetical protein
MITLLLTLLAWAPCIPEGADFKIGKLAKGCPSPIDGVLITQAQYQEFLDAEKRAAILDQCLDNLRRCEADRINVVQNCQRDVQIIECGECPTCSNTAAWSVGACAVCAGIAVGAMQ